MLPLMIMAIEDENDKAFITWLYLQYRRLIYSEIRKVVGDGDEAEDLLQSVVEKLIGKLPLLREMERDKLVNYIISTARNTAYNFRRWRREYEFLRGAAKYHMAKMKNRTCPTFLPVVDNRA